MRIDSDWEIVLLQTFPVRLISCYCPAQNPCVSVCVYACVCVHACLHAHACVCLLICCLSSFIVLTVMFYNYFVITTSTTPKGRLGDFWCLPLSGISGLSFWSHFSMSVLLIFCLVLSLFLPCPFLLLAHSPDLSPPPPLSLHFPKGRLFWVALVFVLFWAVRRWVL